MNNQPKIYHSKKELSEKYDMAITTVAKLIKEMEDSGRYGKYEILRDSKILRVNELAFVDYIANRQLLKDSMGAKYAGKYNPVEVANKLGISTGWIGIA